MFETVADKEFTLKDVDYLFGSGAETFDDVGRPAIEFMMMDADAKSAYLRREGCDLFRVSINSSMSSSNKFEVEKIKMPIASWENLIRLGLASGVRASAQKPTEKIQLRGVRLTMTGRDFVRACNEPRSKSEEQRL